MGERWTGEVIGREDKEGGGKGMDEVWDREVEEVRGR